MFCKIFENIIFNRLYNFLLDEKLLNPNKCGFCPTGSCMSQLFAITREIFEVFDCDSSLEERSLFLDMSKRFGIRSSTKFGIMVCYVRSGLWESLGTFMIFYDFYN